MSVREFAKRNIFGIISILIGIIGVILAIYFYKISVAFPEPVFLLDPSRTIIVDSDRLFETPLQIVRSNGSKIKGDITSVRFYFWNNGRKSIKPINILEPLVITLDDPNGEILDYKILKCSRKVVKPIVERTSVEPKRSLALSFSILEQDDGLAGQVIYEGSPDTAFAISGVVENARSIITNKQMVHRRYLMKSYPAIILVVLLLFFGCISLIYSTTTPKHIKFILCIWLFMVCFVVVFFTARPRGDELTKASVAVIQSVPDGIIP